MSKDQSGGLAVGEERVAPINKEAKRGKRRSMFASHRNRV